MLKGHQLTPTETNPKNRFEEYAMFPKAATPLFALLVLTVASASAQAQPNISGTYSNTVTGMGTSTWTFVSLGGNRYSATETGLGTARGTAVVTGQQLRIDFTYAGGAGYYIVNLNADGTAGTGSTSHTRGSLIGRTWTVNFRRVGGPATSGLVWRESETSNIGTFYGTWTFDASRNQAVGRWNNGANANLTLVQDDGRTAVLRRYDPSGASTTMSAEYVGYRSGNTIRGTVTWYYRGGKNTGTWSASW
jgi:hypothetical protein